MKKSIIYQIASDCENIKSSARFTKYLDYLNTDLNKLVFDLNNELLEQFAGTVACLLDRDKSGVHSVYFTISSLIHTDTEVPEVSITYINVIPSFIGIEFIIINKDSIIENCVLDCLFKYLTCMTCINQIA